MTSSEHSTVTPGTTGRVLVVDDNDLVRRLLSLALEGAGFEVVEAGTQHEAQQRLVDTRPDALILDLQRAEEDGLDLLGQVRACPDLASVPVVFLAGYADDDLRWQAMRAGADWFGQRPIGMLELQRRVKTLVHKGRPHLRAIAGSPRPRQPRHRQKPTG
jgi:two-component system OmpR family response regulator